MSRFALNFRRLLVALSLLVIFNPVSSCSQEYDDLFDDMEGTERFLLNPSHHLTWQPHKVLALVEPMVPFLSGAACAAIVHRIATNQDDDINEVPLKAYEPTHTPQLLHFAIICLPMVLNTVWHLIAPNWQPMTPLSITAQTEELKTYYLPFIDQLSNLIT